MDRFSRSFIQKQRKKTNHETYISTQSPPQEIRSRFPQAHGISQRPCRFGQQKEEGPQKALCFRRKQTEIIKTII
jgi:hypothetical protein